jgi:hypothetical protein
MAELRKAVSELHRERTDVIHPPTSTGDEDSSLPNTVPELQNLIIALRNKCRNKDHIIMALANDLRLRVISSAFENLLRNVALPESQVPEPPPDFDMEQLRRYLNRPVEDVSIPCCERIMSRGYFILLPCTD